MYRTHLYNDNGASVDFGAGSYDTVYIINLTASTALSNPMFGAGGSTSFGAALESGGWTNSAAFGGSGVQTLTSLAGNAVYAMLVPSNTSSNFNIQFSLYGHTYTASAPSLADNQDFYLAPVTTTALGATSSSVYGQPPTFTASVTTGGTAVTSGTVTFEDGTTILGTATVNAASGKASFTPSATALSATASPHTINVIYNGANGTSSTSPYAPSLTSGSQTVTPAALTVSGLTALDKVYDATTAAALSTDGAALLGVYSGDTVTLSTSGATGTFVSADAANSITVSVTGLTIGGAQAGDYTLAQPATTANITPAVQTVTWATPAGITYGTPLDNTELNATVTGVPGGAATGALNYATPAGTVLNAGTQQALTVTAAATTDYLAATATVYLDVAQATLTVTADDQYKNYGDPVPELTATFSGFVNGDTAACIGGAASLSTTATVASPAYYVNPDGSIGGYPITAAQGTLAASNYNFDMVDGTLAVFPAFLMVTPDDQVKTYGSTFTAFTGTVEGLVNGDNITATYTSDGAAATAGVTNGPYEIDAVLNDPDNELSNYWVMANVGSLTVNPAPLTVTADALSQTYGEATPTLTYHVAGFVNGDTASVITGTPILSTDATAASPVGSYTITPDVSDLSADNYSFQPVNNTLTVTPAALTVTTANQTTTYGSTFTGFTGTVTGLQNEDNITVSYSTTAGQFSDVGDYPITATLNDPDGELGNYAVSNPGGTLSITPAEQTIAWANPADIVYGTSLGSDQLDASVAGVPGGTATGDLTYGMPAGTLLNAAAKQALTVTAAATNDYLAATDTVYLNVTPATLTVTPDNLSTVYGQGNPTLTGTLSGVVGSDGITASYNTTAGQFGDVGIYPITATLNDPNNCLSNYNVTVNSGTLSVTPAEQTITWANPADITSGTPLGGDQLNATVTGVNGGAAAGDLTYDPPAGTVLAAGLEQPLTVTAAATTDYLQATATVYLNVTAPVGGPGVWCGGGTDTMWSTAQELGRRDSAGQRALDFCGQPG